MTAHDVKVGRELDAEIAERVMGFVWAKWAPTFNATAAPRVKDRRFLQPGGKRAEFVAAGWNEVPWVLADGTEAIYDSDSSDTSEVPSYSTNIADAWSVVEKLRERGWGFEFQSIHKNDATFSRRSGNRERVHADDCDTAPEAICRAALLAVGAA